MARAKISKDARKLSQTIQLVTIGAAEALAGIEDRTAFWKRFYKPGVDYIPAGVTELRKMIAQRVTAGELSLLPGVAA